MERDGGTACRRGEDPSDRPIGASTDSAPGRTEHHPSPAPLRGADRPICIQAVVAAIIGPVPFGLVQDHTPFVQRMSGARSGNRMLNSDQSNQERWVTYAQAGELLG